MRDIGIETWVMFFKEMVLHCRDTFYHSQKIPLPLILILSYFNNMIMSSRHAPGGRPGVIFLEWGIAVLTHKERVYFPCRCVNDISSSCGLGVSPQLSPHPFPWWVISSIIKAWSISIHQPCQHVRRQHAWGFVLVSSPLSPLHWVSHFSQNLSL